MIASPDAMRWVDLGLRYLSRLVGEQQSTGPDSTPAPPPSAALVRVGAHGLVVAVSPTVSGPLGWFLPSQEGGNGDHTMSGETLERAGGAVILDPEVCLEDLEILAGDHWSAWPALISIGEAADGTGTVLVNLEHAGSLSVEGPSEMVQAVLAGVALQIASQPWSEEMLAGFYLTGDCPLDPRLARLASAELVGVDGLGELAQRLSGIGNARSQLAGRLSLAALRAVACEALPNVVVAFAGTPDTALQALTHAAIPETSGVVVAAAGPCAGAGWTLTLTTEHEGLLEGRIGDRPFSLELVLSPNTKEAVLLSEALGSTVESEDGDDGPCLPAEDGDASAGGADSRAVAGRPGTTSSVIVPEPLVSLPARGQVEICLLGPLDVAGGEIGTLEPSRRMAPLSLLAYAAVHRDLRLSADKIASALWPLGADSLEGPQRKTVMNVISRARAVLGYAAGGRERLVYSHQGYTLSEDVTCDWERFGKLVSISARWGPSNAMATLHQALELVRAEPFSGALSSHFFEWVASENLDFFIAAAVADAAERLGRLALQVGDWAEATWAAGKGLQLDPAREQLFRVWMHALGRSGQPGKVDEVYRRLRLVLQRRIHPLQEPALESREVWRLYTAAEAAEVAGAWATNAGEA
ncbi:MAG TPA: BTAD domain-containing putative transcriptional regulator [Acidimicrobiales bacterium]|nr:BTAD domain-containing putative transcriptional regulator [Acidimicrobiales bacterium]